MSASPAVAAALLNWNGWRDTIACLETLARVRYAALDVYLCDNASTDDSVARILAWTKAAGWTAPRFTLIRHDTNAGFARGTNIAMQGALASGREYLALWALNTDTLVDADAVGPAVTALLGDPRAGSVQSLLLGYPDDTVLDSAGIRLLRRGGSKDLLRGRKVPAIAQPVPIFGSCAASAFYRTTALREVGMFDAALFQTNEDVDLACRLQAAGYHALLVPGSVVRHKGGVSRRRKQGRLWFVANRAKLRVVARWWPRLLALFALSTGALRAFLVMVRFRDVRAGEWVTLLRELWQDYRGGATQAVRRSILSAGSRGFL